MDTRYCIPSLVAIDEEMSEKSDVTEGCVVLEPAAAAGRPVTGRVTNRLSHLRSADASIIRMALAAPRLSAYIHVDAK